MRPIPAQLSEYSYQESKSIIIYVMRKFYDVLFNTLVANVTTNFLWFALTFWVYLETKSVVMTSIIGGSYMLLVAVTSMYFGTLVDKHHKKNIMIASSLITLTGYALGGIAYLSFHKAELLSAGHPAFWLLIIPLLIGAVVESMRNIALSTTVTLLVPKNDRDKANGMIGMVTGMAFLVTSVFSGLAIGQLGMGWTMVIAIALTAVALGHLFFVDIPEEKIFHDPELAKKKVDFAGSLAAIRIVPGLMMLIFFSTFNNFIGGVFMSLMDAYGLTLFSVEMWGFMLAVSSLGFIAGGIAIGKFGLGKNPLRTLLLICIVMALLGAVFAIREWQWLFVLGMFFYMSIIPAAEAAEQTIVQRVVPLKSQGRVFGFSQTVEAAATPITAFAIGPLAQYVFIPYMNGEGSQQLGWLLGSGQARGIALVFVVASLVMLVGALLAFRTKAYRLLTNHYAES